MIHSNIKWIFRILTNKNRVMSSQMAIYTSEMIINMLEDETQKSLLIIENFRDFIYRSIYIKCYPESLGLCLL